MIFSFKNTFFFNWMFCFFFFLFLKNVDDACGSKAGGELGGKYTSKFTRSLASRCLECQQWNILDFTSEE